MARGILFNDEGRVLQDLGSVDSPKYFERDDIALNPPGLQDLLNRNIPMIYWKQVVVALKYVKGNPVMNDVTEMSQTEKDTVDAEIEQKEQEKEANFVDLDKRDIDLLVLAKMTWDEANRVRAWLNKPTIDWPTFKAIYKTTKEGILNFLKTV